MWLLRSERIERGLGCTHYVPIRGNPDFATLEQYVHNHDGGPTWHWDVRSWRKMKKTHRKTKVRLKHNYWLSSGRVFNSLCVRDYV
jgi:hypothetical protein